MPYQGACWSREGGRTTVAAAARGKGGTWRGRLRWGSAASVGRKYYLSYLGQSYSLTRKAKRNEGTA